MERCAFLRLRDVQLGWFSSFLFLLESVHLLSSLGKVSDQLLSISIAQMGTGVKAQRNGLRIFGYPKLVVANEKTALGKEVTSHNEPSSKVRKT